MGNRPSRLFMILLSLGCVHRIVDRADSYDDLAGPGTAPITPIPPDGDVPLDSAAAKDRVQSFERATGATVDAASAQDTTPPIGADAVMADREGAPAARTGCKGQEHAVCLDFESGALDTTWTMRNAPFAIEAGKAAHGQRALHFTDLKPRHSVTISTTQLGAITNVMWGRMYLWVSPGAPMGHTALVNAFDQAGNWYAMGFEFNAYFANWHPPSCCPEKPQRSKVKVPPDRWICVEFLFDGAQGALPRVWADGAEVPLANPFASRPGPSVVQQFKRLELGVMAIHSLSLASYDGDTPPLLEDVYFDDVVFDSKRVGCIP